MRSDVRSMYLYLLTRKDAWKYCYDGASGVSLYIRRYLVENDR